MAHRAAVLLGSPASPIVRASQWDIYCASLVLHHARVTLPSPGTFKAMLGHYGRAARSTRRAPTFMIGAIALFWD
eukprot:8810157-Lingulodinium_polyedra.AAC.1